MPDEVLQAAGALCWRRAGDGGLELLLVRSARWDEWSWPKGKLEPGESRPLAAVREVQEETGVRIRFGPPLPPVRYALPDGRPKQVTYWSAQVAGTGPATASPDEIADVTWLPAKQAEERLTRGTDAPPLHRLLELDAAGLLDAAQLIVVRHAKAVGRSSWDGDEDTRPLTEVGQQQTLGLTTRLDCWRPDRLLSSPWTRCEQSMTPYARLSGLTLEPAPEFTEHAHRRHPNQARHRIIELLDQPGRIALCTHRPVLEVVVATVAAQASRATRSHLPAADPWLAPAQLLIVHHQADQVFWVEIH